MDSKVTVMRGNNQIGKEKDKEYTVAKETDKAKKAKEESEVRVYGGIRAQV